MGGGGTLSALLTYPGNGAAPFTAISINPGSDLVFFNLSADCFVVILAKNNGTTTTFDLSTFTFFYSTPSCTGVGLCGVGQVGLTPGATTTGPVNGQFDPSPRIRTSGVITASAYGGSLRLRRDRGWKSTPRTWHRSPRRHGAAATPRAIWRRPPWAAPRTIGGKPAFLDYVSPGQAKAQVPSNVAPGSQPVVVTPTVRGSSLPHQITVNLTEPGMLSPAAFNLSTGQKVLAVFPSTDPNALTHVLPQNLILGVASALARPGDHLLRRRVWSGDAGYSRGANCDGLQQACGDGFGYLCRDAGDGDVGRAGGRVLGLYQFNVVVPSARRATARRWCSR